MGEMTVESESRYRVVRQGFWYRVAIGTGTRTVGKFWSLLGACAIWRNHYREIAKDWQPLGDLPGVISQIDNMVCGLNAEIARLQGPAPRSLTWSFIRRVLEQGMAIQQDYDNRKFQGYEHMQARLDEAAREREDQLGPAL